MLNEIRDSIMQVKKMKNPFEKKMINEMLSCIGKIENDLDVLWSYGDQLNGLCCYYPEKCLESLSVMKSVLEMEIKDEQK